MIVPIYSSLFSERGAERLIKKRTSGYPRILKLPPKVSLENFRKGIGGHFQVIGGLSGPKHYKWGSKLKIDARVHRS